MAADGAFGEVLEAFTDAGLFDAGLIVAVASDNGGWPCGLNLRGSNAPLRGAKFSYHEGGVRVPGFVFACCRRARPPGSCPRRRAAAATRA